MAVVAGQAGRNSAGRRFVDARRADRCGAAVGPGPRSAAGRRIARRGGRRRGGRGAAGRAGLPAQPAAHRRRGARRHRGRSLPVVHVRFFVYNGRFRAARRPPRLASGPRRDPADRHGHRPHPHAPGRSMNAPALEVHMDADDLARTLRADVIAGLTADRKWLPPKWFYDARGSELFEKITELDEYYPTRAERQILAAHAAEIAGHTRARSLLELGAGYSTKT